MLRPLSAIEGHEDRVWHLSWSPDGKRFATCGEDRTVRIWLVEEEFSLAPKVLCLTVLEDDHTRTIRCCEWSPCSRYLATASFDGFVIVYQNQSGRWVRIATLEGHENEVKCIAWSPDGTFLATCGRDKKVWIWEVIDRNDFDVAAVLDGHTQDVKCIKWHPDSHILFSCGYDDTIKVWNEDDGDWYCVKTLIGHQSTVWSVLPIRQGNVLLSVSDDHSLILWECDSLTDLSKDWRKVCVVSNAHDRAVYSVDWLDSLQTVVTAGADNSIALFALERGDDGMAMLVETGRIRQAHDGDINCVRWRPHGDLLASVGDDSLIKLWQLQV